MDIKLLVATLPEDTKLAPWCRKLGISRQTAYKWRARYRAEGVAGLEDRSRAPKRPAGRVDASVEDAVVAARKQLAEEGLDVGPASIHGIIKMIDDHSRLNVDSLAVAVCTSARVWEAFTRGASRHGLPAEFLDDNGRAYVSLRGEQPVLFQAHLARLGVRQIRARAYHPQTCGKVERFHQTQRRWLAARPAAATLAELQALLDDFRSIYNHSRPHRALGRRTPATVWAAQSAAAPATRAEEPPVLVSASQVGPSGTFSTRGHLIIGLGTEWAYHHVTVVRRGQMATVIDTHTGEIIRELTIDPNRRYQPTGRPRGGPARGKKV